MKRPFAVIGFTVFLTIAFLFDKKTGVTVTALAVFAVALVVALFSKKLRKAKVLPLCMASGAVACITLLATMWQNFWLPVHLCTERSWARIPLSL